jgi:two-component system OmpR family sensor kinase
MISVRKRALIAITVLIALLGVGATFVSRMVAAIEVNKLLDNELEQIAFNAGKGLGESALEQPAFAKMELENRIAFQKWTDDGRVIHENPLAERLPRQTEMGFSDIEYGGHKWRVFTATDGHLFAQAAQRWSARNEIINHTAAGAAVPFLAAFPIAWIAIIVSVDWLLKRLAGFSAILARRGVNAKDPITLGDMPREFAPIVGALNSLIAKHQMAIEQQKQFVSDAAHELRTPLAALQIQIDNLANQSGTKVQDETLRELGSGIRRASSLVRQLLKLARLDAPVPADRKAHIDLKEMVISVVSEFVSLSTKQGVEIGMAIEEGIRVKVSDSDVRLLFTNLIDNAIRYTPRGGNVEVAIKNIGPHTAIEVIDTGAGIPEEAIPRIFDRFYRAAPADIEGTGLGLAIARRIAERNNFKLKIVNRLEQRGVCAQVLIPQTA